MRSKTPTATAPTLSEIEAKERALATEADALAAQRTAIRQQEDLELAGREVEIERQREALRIARLSAQERERLEQEAARHARIAAITADAKKARAKLSAEVEAAEQRQVESIRALEKANVEREQIYERQKQQYADAARSLGMEGATQQDIQAALGKPPKVNNVRIIKGRAGLESFDSCLHQTLTHNRLTDADRARTHVVILLERGGR